MGFCFKHLLPYRYGRCPKCLDRELRALPEAAISELKGRCDTLLSVPGKIDQDVFGVCGMTSAVYLILRSAKGKARELFQATFADLIPECDGKQFFTSGFGPQRIDFTYLARRYRHKQLDWEEKHAQKVEAFAQRRGEAQQLLRQPLLPQDRVKLELYEQQLQRARQQELQRQWKGPLLVDYCLARALGYLLKKTAPCRYADEKLDFNAEFASTRNHEEVTRFGNLALRTNNLAFIMAEIVGAQGMHIATKANRALGSMPLAPAVGGVATISFESVGRLHNLFQTHAGAPGTFAIAAIYGKLVKKGSMVIRTSGGDDRSPRLNFNHWVVIEKFDVTANNVELLIWTWASYRRLRIDKAVFLSYIQDVIFGHF